MIADANEQMKVASEETFGPLAACFRFSTEAEVIQRANNTPFGLAAYFYTQNLQTGVPRFRGVGKRYDWRQ